MGCAMRSRIAGSIFVVVAFALGTARADVQTYDWCDFWPLAVGNQWLDADSLVAELQIVDMRLIDGRAIYQLREVVAYNSTLGIAYFDDMVMNIDQGGVRIWNTVEGVRNGDPSDLAAFPSPLYDGMVLSAPGESPTVVAHAGTLATMAVRVNNDLSASGASPETDCIGWGYANSMPLMIFARGIGPIWDVASPAGALTPALVSTTDCTAPAPEDLQRPHNTDQDGDFRFSLSELLRAIQFHNAPIIEGVGSFGCETREEVSEDGYAMASELRYCMPYHADNNPQDWILSLSELLRCIQFYNVGAYHPCPEAATEDGFCAGLAV